MLIETTSLISVTDANKRGVSALAADAERGEERILLRNNRPVAAVVSMEHLERVEDRENMIMDLSLTVARELTTSERRHSLDEVLDMFGYSRDDLRAADRED